MSSRRVAIKPCPPPGEGVHRWIYHAYHRLREAGWTHAEAEAWIKKHATRDVRRGEIPADGSKPRESRGPKWPPAKREQIEAIAAASGIRAADLREMSPVRLPEAPATREILAALFAGGGLICVGREKEKAETFRLSALLSGVVPHLLQFIVPSPMRAAWGVNLEGKRSARCLDNTGPRRFLVVEGDCINGEPIPKDTQAAVLLHLAEHAPLALVVDSGGKSLHGWFYCGGMTDEQLTPFFRRACTLGADAANWCRCQFARMPDGHRRDPRGRQRALFFKPGVIPGGATIL